MNTVNQHSDLAAKVATVLSTTGLLAQQFPQYRPRKVQQQMATAVAQAIVGRDNLIVEAGTGVGKTFGYLLPILLSKKLAIISTASKNLQDQLFYKDLPNLIKILGLNPKVAMLKGRSNYLCQDKLASQLQQSSYLVTDTLPVDIADELLRIDQWGSQTLDGDISSLTTVSEQSQAIKLVTSSRDSCHGKRCDFYQNCFSRKARIKAIEADIIVVNHHLFFTDRLSRDTIFSERLPDSDLVIFDEAHQLPDIAAYYFGEQLVLAQLTTLLANILKSYKNNLFDTPEIERLTLASTKQLQEWLAMLDVLLKQEVRSQQTWLMMMGNRTFAMQSWTLLTLLQQLNEHLVESCGRDEQLDLAQQHLERFINQLSSFLHCDDHQRVYDISHSHRGITLTSIPLSIAKQCQQLFDSDTRWVFTSATLQFNRQLDRFTKAIGMQKAKQLLLDSPFDYQKNTLFCVPRQLAHVRSEQARVECLVQIVMTTTIAAKGRTFMLFTSHKMMNAVAKELVKRVSLPVLVQGQGSKQSLLNKYRQLGNAVLLGTGAFWQGVDVRGKLLSCVIIDKLPFISPEDPLYKARANMMNEDDFSELSLPHAVLTLNQGVGRLIRDERDRGVFILCDNRIVNQAYGQDFLSSMPPMSRTRDMQKVVKFLQQIR